MDLNVPYIC